MKPPQYKTPHLQDDYGDDSAVRPWNKPVAKGVPPCAAPKRGSVCAHTVQAGETLSSIAQERYGFGGPKTVARIVAVNPGLHPDRIYIGQVLYMPCSCGMAAVPERESEPETSYRYAPSNRISAGSVQFIPIVAY